GHAQFGEQSLYLRGDVVGLAGSKAKQNHAGLEIQPLSNQRDDDESEKNDARRQARDREQTSATSHADGRLHKNGSRRGHAYGAKIVFENSAGTKETNALDDIGGDAGCAGIAPHQGQMVGKNGEERGGHTDKHAGANTGGAMVVVAFRANERAHDGRKKQPQQSIMKGNHATSGPSPLKGDSSELQFELGEFREVACSGVYL